MKISGRTFLKTTVGTILATGFPVGSLPHEGSKPKRGVREFRFSASKARVNLGIGPDFVAWTYIYHSHVNYQLDQGLYGALIIEPAHEQDRYAREDALLLEDWVMRDGGGVANTRRRPPMGMMMRGMRGRRRSSRPGRGPLLEPVCDGYAVNGKVYPEVEPLVVKKGERVKLRILNVSSATIYDLSFPGWAYPDDHPRGWQLVSPLPQPLPHGGANGECGGLSAVDLGGSVHWRQSGGIV